MEGLEFFVVLALSATVVTLGLGVVAMVRGADYDRAHGTQLMGWRVGMQAITLALVLVTVAVLYL